MNAENSSNEVKVAKSDQEFDLVGLFFKYFFYWRWFVASIFICGVLTFIYLRFQTPIYTVNSSVLIKEDDKRRGMMGNNPFAAIQDLGMMSMTNNFDNEVEILKSRTLVKKVVNELGLYIDVANIRHFGYNKPLYKNRPLQVYMTPQEADLLENPLSLKLKYTKEGKLVIQVEYYLNQEKSSIEKTFNTLPAIFPTPVGVVSVSKSDSLSLRQGLQDGDINLEAVISNPTGTAISYVNNLSVVPASKTTTIAQLSLKNSIPKRGIDFINTLIYYYNQDANDEKNEVAQKTAEFIQERIAIINNELGTTESQLADFKQRSGLTDLTSDAKLALEENSKYELQRTENATQIRLVQFLDNYINDPSNADEVIPANVGLQNIALAEVINQYNSMVIERKRLLRTSSENNPAVIHMNTGIKAMRHNVATTVSSVLKGLEIAKSDIERQAGKFESRISNAPKQEKEFMSISRQQEIQAALYIMLLQKREENAITLASTANNGRIIEEPYPNRIPVAPKKMMFFFASFIIGLALPVGVIFVLDLIRFKIENRNDVEAITKVPILGELPLSSNKSNKNGAIVVRENKNDIMEETFRNLRTNLLFMLKKEQQVILFSSTQPGEGKSFVTGNLAVSLAFLGKKVLVAGLDIRKPGLNKVFNMTKRGKGITNYLSDPDNTDLFSLIQSSGISPNLDILLGGPIPPNPTELVASNALEKAIDLLKSKYDYVLLDTAPIGMVTDTSIISRVADMCVYVCRADVTPKASFGYINVLNEEKKFDKLAIVINSIDMSKRKNSYGYGYGKKYGYGYGKSYGYGYGYGYGYEKENQEKSK